MIEGHEAAQGVWLFRSDTSAPNFGIVLSDDIALLVDPGELAEQTNAAERFALEKESPIRLVVHTEDPPPLEGSLSRWIDLPAISPASLAGSETLSLPREWQAITLTPGRLGLHNASNAVLFCGDMLPQGEIPSLKNGAQTYLEALEMVEKIGPKVALPARGAPASGKREVRSRIESDRNYIHATMRHVATSMAARITLGRAEEVARSIYEEYPFVEEHIANVRVLWQELGS